MSTQKLKSLCLVDDLVFAHVACEDSILSVSFVAFFQLNACDTRLGSVIEFINSNRRAVCVEEMPSAEECDVTQLGENLSLLDSDAFERIRKALLNRLSHK